MMINKLKQILLLFTKELNDNDINYALGGSYLLYLEGVKTTVQDIDLLVDINDHEKLKKILKNYKFKYTKANSKYKTEYFYTITIDNVDIDIMLEFKIQTEESLYEFPFKIVKVIEIDNQKVNLSSINEWLKTYEAMKRQDKVDMIKKHLLLKNNIS